MEKTDWPHRLWSFSCGVSGGVSLKQFLIVVLLISKMCVCETVIASLSKTSS